MKCTPTSNPKIFLKLRVYKESPQAPIPDPSQPPLFFQHEFLLYIILFYSALSRTNQDSLSSHPQATKAGIFYVDYSILSVAELTLADHWDSKKIEKEKKGIVNSRARREASKYRKCRRKDTSSNNLSMFLLDFFLVLVI